MWSSGSSTHTWDYIYSWAASASVRVFHLLCLHPPLRRLESLESWWWWILRALWAGLGSAESDCSLFPSGIFWSLDWQRWWSGGSGNSRLIRLVSVFQWSWSLVTEGDVTSGRNMHGFPPEWHVGWWGRDIPPLWKSHRPTTSSETYLNIPEKEYECWNLL